MEAEQIYRLLPWRHPFLMIDRMIECAPHERIVTLKHVTSDDRVVRGDADHGPWFPSMLLLEAMGQSAALLYRLSYDEPTASLPMLGFLKATLHGSAAPGESVTFDVRSVKMTRGGGVFQADAHSSGRLIAAAELAFSASDMQSGRLRGDSVP